MARNHEDMTPESDAAPNAPHPRFTAELFGQAAAEQELLTAYQSGRLPHAWIFGGDKGIGKATLAWRFIKFILANPNASSPYVQQARSLQTADDHPAVHRIHALGHGDVQILRREWNEKAKKFYSEIRAEDVRKAVHMFQMAASEGGYRVVLLDSVEDLNSAAANSLLKMIEEPPEGALFLLISHQPNRILPTIRSRCRLLNLHPLSTPDLSATIMQALPDQNEAQLAGVLVKAEGSASRAVKLLDGQNLDISNRLDAILSRLPRVDWREIHQLADIVITRGGEDEFGTFTDAIYDWLQAQIHKDLPSAQRAAFAESWEKISTQIQQTEAYNLDKRALLLFIFSNLSEAATRR